MKKTKKLLSTILITGSLFTLTACKDSKTNNKEHANQQAAKNINDKGSVGDKRGSEAEVIYHGGTDSTEFLNNYYYHMAIIHYSNEKYNYNIPKKQREYDRQQAIKAERQLHND